VNASAVPRDSRSVASPRRPTRVGKPASSAARSRDATASAAAVRGRPRGLALVVGWALAVGSAWRARSRFRISSDVARTADPLPNACHLSGQFPRESVLSHACDARWAVGVLLRGSVQGIRRGGAEALSGHRSTVYRRLPIPHETGTWPAPDPRAGGRGPRGDEDPQPRRHADPPAGRSRATGLSRCTTAHRADACCSHRASQPRRWGRWCKDHCRNVLVPPVPQPRSQCFGSVIRFPHYDVYARDRNVVWRILK
jgi:hypothetical protein